MGLLSFQGQKNPRCGRGHMKPVQGWSGVRAELVPEHVNQQGQQEAQHEYAQQAHLSLQPVYRVSGL
jgi:hypothetical protein